MLERKENEGKADREPLAQAVCRKKKRAASVAGGPKSNEAPPQTDEVYRLARVV
jgi:hypothetical protein